MDLLESIRPVFAVFFVSLRVICVEAEEEQTRAPKEGHLAFEETNELYAASLWLLFGCDAFGGALLLL